MIRFHIYMWFATYYLKRAHGKHDKIWMDCMGKSLRWAEKAREVLVKADEVTK